MKIIKLQAKLERKQKALKQKKFWLVVVQGNVAELLNRIQELEAKNGELEENLKMMAIELEHFRSKEKK